MAKIRRVFHCLAVFFLILGFTSGPGRARASDTNNSPERVPQPGPPRQDWVINQTIPDTFVLAAENAVFQLYMNEATLAFKVVDKRSGYIWHSNLDEKVEGDRLNKTWTAFADSGITIEYLDDRAVNERASIANSEHTSEVRLIDQGFEATVQFTEVAITVGVIVRLDEAGVRVEVPFDSIKESGDFKLGMLHLYPFMGATRGGSVPGYMFIPDGSGSLIRFSAETKAKNMFYQRYYGADLGILAELPYDPQVNRPYSVSLPVTGMSHGFGEHAYIAIVEKGAPYGEIQAHPAGIITNFNFLYNAFIYNQSYFQATNRSGAGVTTIQPSTNAFDVQIYYRFLTGEGSDYVGMARSYQQYLVEKGILKKAANQNSDIGIRLEFLGAEKEKFLFWFRTIPMTTIGQMTSILEDLGIQNKDVVYYGWQPHGASSMPPKTMKVDAALGSAAQLRSFAEDLAESGGNFYLYYDPQAALWGEGGYSARNDLAMAITNVNMIGYNRDKVNYFLNYETLLDRYTTLSRAVASDLEGGLALDMFGSMLYSDFKRNHILNREAAIVRYQTLLAENPVPTAFYAPNDYMFAFMNAYYDIPLGSSGYIYTNEAVPFLQIVLSGYVPFYGPPMNFSSNARQDLLRHVDFGVYPSYFLSNEATALILETPSNWIYTSSYRQWGEDIKQTYQWLNSLLGPVKGETIVAREVLRSGVVATTYSNGYQLVVNYNDSSYSAGEFEVSSWDAILRKVEP